MIVLYFGDIFGRVGRRAVAAALPGLRAKYQPDFVLGNAENLAGGKGVNKRAMAEMYEMGFHGFSSGNHIWDNKEVYSILESDTRLVRPANYPELDDAQCPGKGFAFIQAGTKRLCLINLMGRVFMQSLDCPFRKVDAILKNTMIDCPIIVDLHADATSEKYAMAWHLAGRISAFVGTHTHVQTADERILPGGTAYITDIGMSGAFDSVIGIKKEEVIRRFMSNRPHHYQNAKDNPGVGCVIITIDEETHQATAIERLRFEVELGDGNDGGGE